VKSVKSVKIYLHYFPSRVRFLIGEVMLLWPLVVFNGDRFSLTSLTSLTGGGPRAPGRRSTEAPIALRDSANSAGGFANWAMALDAVPPMLEARDMLKGRAS
jgi:hypothetical protein